MNNLHLIVRDQFPDFVREDYPAFVAFVQAYYKWLDEQSVGKIEDVADLDKTPEQFVHHFRTQLDSIGLFNGSENVNKLYLQKIKEIYSAKGSEQALVNIIKFAYNKEARILYPVDNILKASAGNWFQEKFIVIQSVLGEPPTNAIECYIQYDQVGVPLEVSRVEKITNNQTRVYFRQKTGLSISENQFVYFYDSNKTVIYAGTIIKVPAKITVLHGGNNWQLGQIITIPGSIVDTIARVSNVSVDGEILDVEIIQHGYNHTENQVSLVSPYPNKPVNSLYDINKTIISTNPLKYEYTLTLNDYTTGANDRVVGVYSGLMRSSYFLENYAQTDYTGDAVFDNITYDEFKPENANTDITIEQWMASRATLVYNFDVLVKQRGRWLNESGMISNESIKIQDSFYYQQFSYDIEANVGLETYRDLVNNLNPAGMKMFARYALGEIIEVPPIASTSFPFLKIDLLDVPTTEELDYKLIVKRKDDAITTSDFDKQIVAKRKEETLTISDVDVQFITKKPVEVLTISETRSQVITKNPVDTLTANEVISKNSNKYVTDSIAVSSSDNSVFEIVQYNTEGYFDELYVYTEQFLTIGE